MSTTYTTNYHLGKQTDTSDNFSMTVITDNMDIIDGQMKANADTMSNQQDTIADGGNGYAIINGIRLYVSSTAPTGDIPDGSIGVGW